MHYCQQGACRINAPLSGCPPARLLPMPSCISGRHASAHRLTLLVYSSIRLLVEPNQAA
jgi:hypothetical protein